MQSPEERKIELLYALLESKEAKKDNQAESALRWAIFELESMIEHRKND